jgi:hypothetical protein
VGGREFTVERETGFQAIRFGGGIWSAAVYAIPPELRCSVWEADLEFEVFAPKGIAIFRVACAYHSGDEFPAVKERYVDIPAGRTLCTFRIADLTDLRPGLTPDTLTEINLGGWDDEFSEVQIALRLNGRTFPA